MSVHDRTAVIVGDPPGDDTFSSDPGSAWLDAPVYPRRRTRRPHLIDAVCQELATQAVGASQVTLADLLPGPDEPLWTR